MSVLEFFAALSCCVVLTGLGAAIGFNAGLYLGAQCVTVTRPTHPQDEKSET